MLFGSRSRIRVTLVTHGVTARMLRAGSYELPKGAKVRALLEAAGPVPPGIPLVMLIGGARIEEGHKLSDGDEVTVLQFAAGG